MNAFNALVKKDLILYFSNRRAVIVSIVAPILIAAFFGYVFGSGSSAPSQIAVGVTDLDHSPLTDAIVHDLKADPTFALTELDASNAAAQIKAGKIAAAVTFPAGFGAAAGRALFARSDKPAIAIQYDPSQQLALQVVRGLLAQYVMQNVSKSVFTGSTDLLPRARADIVENPNIGKDTKGDLLSMFDSIQKVQQDATAKADGEAAKVKPASFELTLPYTTEEKAAAGDTDVPYNGYAHSFAGMSVQFILFMGIDLGIGLLAMRRLDLWKRLRAAPLSKTTLLGSRIVSCAAIALVIFTAIYAVAMAMFGVRIQGSVIGFCAVVLAFALFTSSFGLMIASLGKSPEATRGIAIVVTLFLVMLGGAWVPSFVFPKWLQTASLAVPTRWAVDGLDGMTWRGLGVEHAVGPVVVMLAFTLVFGALAIRQFTWEE
jgi:ABC-2 type transport system permease protein